LLTRQVTLKPSGRKPPDLGPRVQVAAVHLSPGDNDAGLQTLISGAGLRDRGRNGLLEQDTDAKHMWSAAGTTNLVLEFELPEAVALGAIEVWNYNAEWQTRTGVRKADVLVSPDGTNWERVLRGTEFAEADGNADYDEPIQLKLKGVPARKVRFENIVPWNDKGNVGLSKVVFHQAPGPQAGPQSPGDGMTGVNVGKAMLEWVAGQGASEHQVYFGTAPDNLTRLAATRETRLEAPQLKPGTTYFWRVDETQADGKVVKGRVARFGTAGLVAWWKLNEIKGTAVEDASGHQLTGKLVGRARWAPDHQGRAGGALEFDGETTFVNSGQAAEFDFSDAMSVVAWIKVREFDKPWQAIVTKGDWAWRLQRQKDTGQVTFCFNTSGLGENSKQNKVRLVSKRKIDDGQWHHVAGVSDGRRAALYVDSELEDSAAPRPIAQTSAPVRIGSTWQTYPRGFNGWIEDVRLYGYGLSQEEVKALYRGAGADLRAEK
jgi:hypothetical protein